MLNSAAYSLRQTATGGEALVCPALSTCHTHTHTDTHTPGLIRPHNTHTHTLTAGPKRPHNTHTLYLSHTHILYILSTLSVSLESDLGLTDEA